MRIHKNNDVRQEDDFNRHKVALNDHLKGEYGASTFNLFKKSKRAYFSPDSVQMGLTASCPMPLRREIIAQHNYRANKHCCLNERMANLTAGTLGVALSLPYRVVRAALRTIFSPFTFLYSLYQQHRYGIDGWAKEDLKRIGWEWIDVGTTLVSFFAGIINTFHPNAIKLDSLRDYYVKRTNEAIERNQKFAEAKQQYLIRRDEIYAAEHAAHPS